MEIIKYIHQQISQGIYRGASLAIFDKGAWSDFYIGTLDGDRPVTSGLVYDLASVSKVVGVGTVLIQLLSRNKIALDDNLVVYYPDFHDETVTLRQLVTHTSGIDPFIKNRNQMSSPDLKKAINKIKVTKDKRFLYTDINFLLLGFMLENYFEDSLDTIFTREVFVPFGMTETCFGPVEQAVPTQKGKKAGIVHDPKAAILGVHSGSAGLFSTVSDLKKYAEHYLVDTFAKGLTRNVATEDKKRSIAWDLDNDWLLHTGYTGTFVMINQMSQQAVIFLSNRTYDKDNRKQWIKDRNQLIEVIKKELRK
ncbi:serine hydrolase domain-containing protein [Streptococcus sciuri]|uniref:Beta-lactamase family protein n=1 Tax=Streptococcus sciuri TaxID=2973939 RepID=A0ABT2F8U2_9STRE|nr:serine hydrolase domain-containing protein [Streptococcus sciuri]MCS4488247.1 beta-lactamase family protein [Streptococcus sciuri]